MGLTWGVFIDLQVHNYKMFNVTFGKNKIQEFSSSHHDIWNTNKLKYSDKFEPIKWLDNNDKVKVGRYYKPRHVNIMQFSEQKWNQKGKNDMNPVELRLGYMKSKTIGRNDNFGYQRDDLTKKTLEKTSQHSIFNLKPKTTFLNPFEKPQNTVKFRVFNQTKPKNVVDSPFKTKTPSFQFDKPKDSQFKFEWPKTGLPSHTPHSKQNSTQNQTEKSTKKTIENP